MSDVLLFWSDESAKNQLAKLAEESGVRIRAVSDLKGALEWIKLRRYDAVLVHYRTTVEEQQALAGELWATNPNASFFIYDLSDQLKLSNQEARLFGADIARGKDALSTIDSLFKKLGAAAIKNEDFRIMVVEDLDSPRDIICFYIESLGFSSVTGMRSAREAMLELEREPNKYSCVITDMRMPEISGAELIKHIRKHDKLWHLPVVVLTAHGTVDTLIDCLKAGASGFLVKPPKKADLTREIARAVRIISGRSPARLATSDEAEQLKNILIDRGLA